jgi:membrane-bound lytic murein transglycosylase MltF
LKKYLAIIVAFVLIILGVFLMKKLVIKQKAERLYETTRFRNLSSIVQSETFIVGTTINPISFYYYKDTKAGFEYEIAKEIAKKLNLNLQIITVANDSTLYS